MISPKDICSTWLSSNKLADKLKTKFQNIKRANGAFHLARKWNCGARNHILFKLTMMANWKSKMDASVFVVSIVSKNN